MTKKINVLSLFNGMSFGMMALETCGIEVGNYYSSEIDKYAIQATKALYPDIIQLGDVTKWRQWDIDWSNVDLLLAGFPCQAWSIAGKQEGDNDPRGALVHDLIDIWNEIKKHNPNMKFMFENVKMKKEFLDYINELFGVEPVCINSALVSAQNRVRYYWTNIDEVEQPKDKRVLLADIIESGVVDRDKSYAMTSSYQYGVDPKQYFDQHRKQLVFANGIACRATVQKNAEHTFNGKCPTLTASMGMGGGNVPLMADHKTVNKFKGMYIDKDDRLHYRKLTPRECMRLQTVPERHINTLLSAGISNTQLYKMTGNGWTHDVIVHIFKGLHKWSNL